MSDDEYVNVEISAATPDTPKDVLEQLSRAALQKRDGYKEVLSVLSQSNTSVLELSQAPKRRGVLQELIGNCAPSRSAAFVRNAIGSAWFDECLSELNSICSYSTTSMDSETLASDRDRRLAYLITTVCLSSAACENKSVEGSTFAPSRMIGEDPHGHHNHW
jgi:hypothetical protein